MIMFLGGYYSFWLGGVPKMVLDFIDMVMQGEASKQLVHGL